MVNISFSKFRQNAKDYLDAVEKGEIVQVMRHGKVIARIVPPRSTAQPSWKNKGLKMLVSGASLSRAIIENRKED